MTTSSDSLRTLAHALDQAGDVLDRVNGDVLERRTPCEDWTVGQLADHLIDAPRRFLVMVRGDQPDWSAGPPHVEDGWGPTFRVAADDLIHAVHQAGGESAAPLEMEVAEIAVHTWDLAMALGAPPVDSLDPEVAETGLAFMQANLTDDNRGEAFGPAQLVPDDADAYRRLAAFAGRR